MRTHHYISIIAALIALAIANYLVARHPVRWDLTGKRIYTLSDSTKKILSGLDDVATVRIYFTQDMPPALEPLRRDVDDLLGEFKRAAGPRMQIEHVDPGASGMEEQRAQIMGIPPIQLNVFNKDKQEVAKIYLGMAVMYGDKQQVIPVVQDTGNLEYEIAEALVKVSSKELKKVAWWEPRESGKESGFGIIKELLSRRYDIAEVNNQTLSDLTPDRFAALVLASPRNLSGDELFAIDQYVMAGGKLAALIDRWDVGPQLSLDSVPTDATELLTSYGATVEDSLVLDDQDAMAAFGGGVVTYHMPYPYWPDVRRGGFRAGDPVTANLQSAVFPWTSPLTLNPDAQKSRSAGAIASTTDLGTVIAGKDAKLDPQSANAALRAGQHAVRPILAILTGPFKSYFSGKEKPSPQRRDAKAESAEGARIFVAGSSRWVNDRFLRDFPQNAALFQNVLDLFAMSDALVGIRSREETNRPIVEIPDAGRMVLRYANLAAGPLVLAVIGSITFIIRRRQRRAAAHKYSRT